MLQEKALTTALLKAAGLAESSKDAQAVRTWRDVTYKTAGNFAKTVEEVTLPPALSRGRQRRTARARALSPVLSPPCAATRQRIFRHRCEYPDLPASASREDAEAYLGRFTLKVGALNALLDELVVADRSGRFAKASPQGGGAAAATKADVLGRIMRQTTPKQMRWIVQIILGKLKARCESLSNTSVCVIENADVHTNHWHACPGTRSTRYKPCGAAVNEKVDLHARSCVVRHDHCWASPCSAGKNALHPVSAGPLTARMFLCAMCRRAGRVLWCFTGAHGKGGRCVVSCGVDSEASAAQVRLSENSALKEYHPDALDMVNVTDNLEKVLLTLRDKTKRFPRQVAPLCAPCCPGDPRAHRPGRPARACGRRTGCRLRMARPASDQAACMLRALSAPGASG